MTMLSTPIQHHTTRSPQDLVALYQDLLHAPQQHLTSGRQFLREQLRLTTACPCDLPADPLQLGEWVTASHARTAQAYRDYLTARKQGQPRRFFSNRAHALYFLRNVAPTKLVDGAWLYGVLPHWQDWRFHTLVRTYLEELGDGEATQNHVLLYKQLLASHDIDDIDTLPADHFVQGAQQLALGHLAAEFLPELIGYNLGYEQLPLHLLITTYELGELDIDPYYFQLHVTIDNAATGHAKKAAQAVLDNLPTTGNRQAFYDRVRRGYQLNELGLSATAVITGFNLEQELHRVLEQKARIARNMHADFCRIEGRTVNEWLSETGRIGGFLAALEKRDWIRRHADPEASRFWQLIQGNRAPMFGVFSPYEQQLLYDWIAGEWQGSAKTKPARRFASPGNTGKGTTPKGDFNSEQRLLQQELQALPEPARTQRLIDLMAPTSHHTPAGLMATRLFSRQAQ